jgi:hypothetical protein
MHIKRPRLTDRKKEAFAYIVRNTLHTSRIDDGWVLALGGLNKFIAEPHSCQGTVNNPCNQSPDHIADLRFRSRPRDMSNLAIHPFQEQLESNQTHTFTK